MTWVKCDNFDLGAQLSSQRSATWSVDTIKRDISVAEMKIVAHFQLLVIIGEKLYLSPSVAYDTIVVYYICEICVIKLINNPQRVASFNT